MATLKHQTIVTVTGEDLRQLLTDEFCRSYNMLGELNVTSIRPVEGGDFELTLDPKPVEPAEPTPLRTVA